MHLRLRHTAIAVALAAGLAVPWTVGLRADGAAPVERAAVPMPAHTESAGGDGFALSYDVYKSGFRVLTLDFDVALGEGRYRTDAKLESAGIIGWLFEWRLEALSDGLLEDTDVVPQRHRFANRWRGRGRSVEIGYRAGVPADVRADPPYGNDAARAVSPDMLPGSVDPMSAATAIVLANATGPLCPPTIPVYDGRRRYNALLAPLGTKDLKPSNVAAFSGPAEGCRLDFERIAGFKQGDDRMNKMSVDIWLADIGTGAKVPVRLELDTPWGIGFAHLAWARNANGALLFGETE